MSFEYLSPTDHNLLCPLCLLPFTEPWMSATCEHVYCKICILEHLQTSETCPCDRRPLEGSIEAGQLVPAPRLVKLLCDELPVSCSVCSNWTGQRADWSRHTRVECGKDTSIPCKNGCGFRSEQPSTLQEHHYAQCPRRSVRCESCDEELLAEEAEKHALECSSSTKECPHCHASNFTSGALSQHLSEECPRMKISCPHSRFGCSASDSREAILNQHLPNSCSFEPIKTFLIANDQRLQSLQAENRELTDRVAALRADCAALDTRMSRIQQRVGLGETEGSTVSLEDTVAALAAQVAELSRSNSEARRAADRTQHDMRGEVTSMQMGLHELRGEMIAFQQAQHYEHASRLYSRTNSEASTSAGLKDGKTPSSSSAGDFPVSMISPSQQMYTPFAGPGYPFPPYMGAPPTQPFYGPPNMMMQPPPPGRRFYGWPYGMYGGGTSPDGGPGGGTKL